MANKSDYINQLKQINNDDVANGFFFKNANFNQYTSLSSGTIGDYSYCYSSGSGGNNGIVERDNYTNGCYVCNTIRVDINTVGEDLYNGIVSGIDCINPYYSNWFYINTYMIYFRPDCDASNTRDKPYPSYNIGSAQTISYILSQVIYYFRNIDLYVDGEQWLQKGHNADEVNYQWSSVPAISGKNGILSLPVLIDTDGNPVSNGSASDFSTLPDSVKVRTLADLAVQ